MLYLFFLSSDALTSGDIGSYELIRTESYFTLYDNSSARKAKIVITFPTTTIYWSRYGTEIGNILPCNPSVELELCSYQQTTGEKGWDVLKILTSGLMYGYCNQKITGDISTQNTLSRAGLNGTYYWTY